MKKQEEKIEEEAGGKIMLQLFVSGMSLKSMEAINNLKQICERYLENNYSLDIIDIYKNPEMAREQQIVFSPCLVKKLPEPRKLLVGTLEDTEKVIKALGININE